MFYFYSMILHIQTKPLAKLTIISPAEGVAVMYPLNYSLRMCPENDLTALWITPHYLQNAFIESTISCGHAYYIAQSGRNICSCRHHVWVLLVTLNSHDVQNVLTSTLKLLRPPATSYWQLRFVSVRDKNHIISSKGFFVSVYETTLYILVSWKSVVK